MNKNWNELSVEEKKWLFEWNKRKVRKEGDEHKKGTGSN